MSAVLLWRAVACLAALGVDAVLGEPSRWHPLAGFGRLAQALERRCYGSAELSPVRRRCRGMAALALAVLPWVLLAYGLARLPYVAPVAEVIGLYAAIGRRSLGQHALPVAEALDRGDLPLARRRVALLVSRDSAELPPQGVAKACVESVLENGCDAVFGALFWFCLAGLPGVVLYRLANTLDAMWGYKNERYRHFGWAAARLDDVLNYLPARGTALAYCLAGNVRQGLACWRRQAPVWKSPNAGPVMAAGAGALGVQLGGEAVYGGRLEQRPPLGEGSPASSEHIGRALRLLDRALAVWLAVLLAGGWWFA
ncbi:adenosylcobinamide-phosphate synthase CbiB [Methylogaea oryzae]|uniref:Cobalamin biosynthesis protein CobD n=1 Tax=Methylogaea oryzae TaxID=1295382 RepID=A0A8D4VMF0_9GAMM|nr:adenosylcobinamide-phosphate synthase CbiB [Methylogaea oryzae]BBL70520.1 cobalamin biosynthesis protein CobD [Methylogaea oryzae]